MPLYEYQCEACGNELEVLQKISDAPLLDCPACSAPALRKRVSAAGFRLAGSGWYETDFKKDKQRNLKEGGSGGSAPASGEGGGKAASPEGKSGTSEKTATGNPTVSGSAA